MPADTAILGIHPMLGNRLHVDQEGTPNAFEVVMQTDPTLACRAEET
jgi:hypothetical protein